MKTATEGIPCAVKARVPDPPEPRRAEARWRVYRWRSALTQLPIVTVALGLAACAMRLIPSAAAALQFDSAATLPNQPWRLLTCHWTHWSAAHLGWSGGAFALLGIACESRARGPFVAAVAGSALLVPLFLLGCGQGPFTYRGLSGIDSALFALLAVTLFRDRLRLPGAGRRTGAAMIGAVLAAFVAKLAYEFSTGASVFADSAAAGFVPSPTAHLAGAAVGAVTAFLRSRREHSTRPPATSPGRIARCPS